MSSFMILVDTHKGARQTQNKIRHPAEKSGLQLRVCEGVEKALKELTNQTGARVSSTLILLSPNLDDPIAAARRLTQKAAFAQFAFLTNGTNSTRVQQLKSFVANAGNNWSIIDLASENLTTIFENTLNIIHQPGNGKTKQSPLKLKAIVESSHDAIIGKTLDGTIFSWNAAAEEMYGYKKEEALGKPISIIVPLDRQGEVIEILKKLRRGQNIDQFETVRKRKNGKLIDVSLMFSLIKDRNGKVEGASIIARNITTSKRAEARFQLALDAAPSGIILTDDQGKITFVNSQIERYFGYSSDELIGQNVELLIPKSHRKNHPVLRREFLQNPETRPMGSGRDLFAVRKDSSEFPVEVGLNPIKTEHGIEVLAVVVDITQRKRMEEERLNLEKQLQHTQKLESLGILAGGIAHDFNNLLTGILGNADLALLELSPVSPIRKYIENVQKSAIRASDLSNQMLGYSGKGRFQIQALDLNQVIEEMTHLLRVSISKTAVLKYNLYEGLPAMEGDATQIRQVIMNLITNASESLSDKSGIISITTGVIDCDVQYLAETSFDEGLEEGFYVYLEIADTGVGMDKETQSKIFDPFFTTKVTGRGLGLAAVMGIVRGHKGAIKVYSEKGRGTTFKLLFPCSDKPTIKLPHEAIDIGSYRAEGTVLVVDDEESVRAVARDTLERAGFKIVTAPDGREGLKLFEEIESQLSLVILDLTMPHLGGEEVFRKIRRLKSDMPVILISGYNEHELSSRFAGKGLAGFVQKPLRPANLLVTVKQALESKK